VAIVLVAKRDQGHVPSLPLEDQGDVELDICDDDDALRDPVTVISRLVPRRFGVVGKIDRSAEEPCGSGAHLSRLQNLFPGGSVGRMVQPSPSKEFLRGHEQNDLLGTSQSRRNSLISDDPIHRAFLDLTNCNRTLDSSLMQTWHINQDIYLA
jgi:hypothetical protein